MNPLVFDQWRIPYPAALVKPWRRPLSEKAVKMSYYCTIAAYDANSEDVELSSKILFDGAESDRADDGSETDADAEPANEPTSQTLTVIPTTSVMLVRTKSTTP